MLGYFEQLASGIESKLASAGPDEPRARKVLALETARLGVRLFSGRERLAWCGVLVPFDLLHAMGLTSCFVEFVGATLAADGAAAPLLGIAEQAGFATDSCGYHRAVLGAVIHRLMPAPQVVIATSAPCSGGLAAVEEVARRYAAPLFVLDVPLARSDGAVAYLADQLRALSAFVTTHTGVALDRDRLAAAVDQTNRARVAMLEVYRLAQAVPSPARPRDLVNFALVVSLLFGTEAAVRVADAYREELGAKVARGEAGVPGEQLRLLWLQNRIQFRTPVETLLEREYRATVAADELNSITWDPIDPDDPYPGMARRILSVCIAGSLDHRLANLRRMARDYRVDGAINPCHWGCRQGTGARGLVERALREIGVPVLNLEVDCVDQRNFSEGQVRTRLEAFMEMLLERRAAPA